MPVKKKVHKKMDRKLFAASQPWEVQTVMKKYPSIPKEVILKIAKKAGRSRIKLYQELFYWAMDNIY